MKIAIIGGGVAGLTAGYLLNKQNEIKLFEKSDRIGGNAYTITLKSGETPDIAAAAFGKAGYKHFYAMLKHLGIGTQRNAAAYLSFKSLDTGEELILSPTLRGLIAQRFRLLHPKRIGPLLRVFRGLRKAFKMLHRGELEGMTVAQCLDSIPEFRGDSGLIFMGALCLLSSMFASEIYPAPASFFIKKLAVHNDVVSFKALYSVRTVNGGTKSYVNALSEPFKDKVVLSASVEKITRPDNRIEIQLRGSTQKEIFDAVIFACPADEILPMLDAPDEFEKRLLGPWKYKNGDLTVHSDFRSFPAKKNMGGFTYLYTGYGPTLHTSVNGGLFHLPYVSRKADLICSQHVNFPIKEELVEYRTVCKTPIFDNASVPTIKELPALNGRKNSYHCGSHFGHGLHEDAVASAIAVARMLGAVSPF